MEKKTLSKYASTYDRSKFKVLNEEMSYSDYIDLLSRRPKLARNAFQYMFDMIVRKGTRQFDRYRKTYTHYNFFDDPVIPIYGLEETLDQFVNFISGAAGHYGTQNRVLLFHGPVGSSKSTICRLLKKGLQEYSQEDDGAWFTYKWVDLPCEGIDAVNTAPIDACPMNEDPLKLMPMEMREEILKDLNHKLLESVPESDRNAVYELVSQGELCPRCQKYMDLLLIKYDGDWEQVVNKHIRVYRRCHSETRRVGIGTFQPKDEKNQDSTELTGDLNFGKVGEFGSDSDSRAFNFDGEFCVANRGLVEFIEMLKLSNEFLYDLLGVSQEHNIKPKKFSQVSVDEVVIGHTNGAEFERLTGNRFMEALRDRTVKIDVPYLLRWAEEIKVYDHTYGPGKVKQHIMPHTLEIAAFFAILTRLRDDKETKLDLRDKAKLYDGQALPGWTEDSVKELRDKYPDEGLKDGVSARFIQDKISNCLARKKDYVNVFEVLNELKLGLYNSSLIDVEHVKKYEECLDLSIKELQEILKSEVQRAMVGDGDLIVRLCAKYIDNVVAYVNEEKVQNPITKQDQEPDERLMRSIEEKIDIPEQGANDFRRSLAAFIGTLHARKREFRWDSNAELKRALEAKLFEDTRHTIKLSSLSSEASICDPELQEKIDAIKTRLVKQYGYNWQSATDVLDYVSSIFASGPTAK
jgi:serine protein kinase